MNRITTTYITLCILSSVFVASARVHNAHEADSTTQEHELNNTTHPVTIQHHYHSDRKKQVAGTLTTGALLAASLRFGRPIWRYMSNFAHMPQSIHEIQQAVSEMKPTLHSVKEMLRAVATKYELQVIKREMVSNHTKTEAPLARIEEKLDQALQLWN